MKIGVISDIHGNHAALHAVLSKLRNRVDLIIFLGDIAGYYPFVNECMELLALERVTSVRGNHDDVLIKCISSGVKPDETYNAKYGSALSRSMLSLSEKNTKLIESWPDQQRLIQYSSSIAIFHGAPWNPLEGRVYPDFTEWEKFDACSDDIILLGHTHYQFSKRSKDKLIINPGSIGQSRDRSGAACYAELDFPGPEVRLCRCDYDPAPIIQDAILFEKDFPYLVRVLGR